MYALYLTYGEPHSVRTFLRSSCVIARREPPLPDESAELQDKDTEVFFGTNIATIDHQLTYLTEKNSELRTEPPQPTIYANHPDPHRFNLYLFRSLGSRRILRCIHDIIPPIIENGVIVNLEYPLTFLEFYEIILSCTNELVKEKAKRERKETTLYVREMLNDLISTSLENISFRRAKRSSLLKDRKIRLVP